MIEEYERIIVQKDTITVKDTIIVKDIVVVVDTLDRSILDSAMIAALGNPNPNYDAIVRSINRIGDRLSEPIQTMPAFQHAYELGYRILLCDLVFTADNVPVLSHDSYLNQHYKNVRMIDGSEIPDPSVNANRVWIKNTTYQELYNNYDFGVYRGEIYKGTRIPTFEEMVRLCRMLGVELYVEVKEMTTAQVRYATEIVQRYAMVEKTSWSGSKSQMQKVGELLPTARLSIMPPKVFDKSYVDTAVSLKTGKNKVFLFGWDSGILTDELVDYMIENDVAFEMGTLNKAADIISYYQRGKAYKYCTGMETQTILAGKVLLEDALARASNINLLCGHVVNGVYYDYKDGISEIDWDSWSVIDGYIPISDDGSYDMISFVSGKKGNVHNFTAYLYDENKNYMKNLNFGEVQGKTFNSLTIPAGVKYVRFSGTTIDFPTLVFGDKTILEHLQNYVKPYNIEP